MKKNVKAQEQSNNETQFPAGNNGAPLNTKVSLLPHQLAETVPGEMSDDEFNALVVSVKEDGLRNPIVLFEGKILDGRARYKACTKAGVTCTTTEFTGTAQQAASMVLDNNLHRRQLNSMQKAIVAAHMHLRKENPLTQKDAALRVGCGVATVNLAVRLLNSNNTPLIKRCERGDATRSEIDEILFDREAARQQSQVRLVTKDGAPVGGDDDDDLIGDSVGTGQAPGNVISGRIPAPSTGSGQAGKKPTHPERNSTETPASRAVQHFKGLSDVERKHFVTMAWQWLEPALQAAGKLAAPPAPVAAKPPVVKVKAKAPAKRKAA